MINYPVIYHRDFRNDFSPESQKAEDGFQEAFQKKVRALLPLLCLKTTFRGPISLGMSGLRSITHVNQLVEHIQNGNVRESSFHFINASLSSASIGLFFFNPVLAMFSSSTSDLIINFRRFIKNGYERNLQEAIESLSFLTLDLLFIASFCYGAIEITVACMLLQIYLDLYLAADSFKKGEYFEGLCQGLLAGAHLQRVIPQLKLLKWKWDHHPVFSAELKQDKKGFIYLDIPDEYLQSLAELYRNEKIELPPYFGKGMAGAHVSVILSNEIAARNGLTIRELGKKFTFRIVHMDSVKPDGWKGVDQVCFLTLSCPELESMRKQYGFSPKISDHDFHITFGIHKERA